MESDLCNLLPYEVRADLRIDVLATLLWGSPRTWRLRRVDRYRDRDGTLFDHEATIDFRVSRRTLVESLQNLRSVYTRAPSLLRHAEPEETTKRLDQLIAAAEADSGDPLFWSAMDAIVPVGWLYGPATHLEASVDGRPVAPLNRIDTAEVVARSLAYLLVRFVDASPQIGRSLGDLSVVRRYVWLITVCDTYSLTRGPGMRFLNRRSAAAREEGCANWIESVLKSYDVLDPSSETLKESVHELIKKIDAVTGRHLDKDRAKAFSTPLYNPLLLFPSFMSRIVREAGQEAVLVPFMVQHVFFREARQYVDLVDKLLTMLEEDGSDLSVAADTLVMAINRLIWLWPLLVRTDFDVDRTHSSAYKSVDASTDRGRHRWRSYDLYLGDAVTYHVELEASHGELELVPGSATVADADGANLDGGVTSIFDRASVTSNAFQAFYTSAPWVHADSSASMVGARLTFLKVRQRVSRVVMLTNWLVVAGLVLGTAYLWFLALCDIGSDPHGKFTVVGVFKSLIPVYLAVLLLFTLERHGSAVVSKRLRWPWMIAILALVLGSAAVALHAWRLDPSAYPSAIRYAHWGRMVIDWIHR